MTRFDEVRATFWGEDPHGDPPPLTDAAVRDAEHRLGVRLPASLLALLRDRDGGVVADAWDAYPTGAPTSWSDDHVPFDLLMGIAEEDGDRLSLLDSPSLAEEWGLPSPLVLLSGDGHTWIALDYRTCGGDGEPSVTWFDADEASELPLARDFRTFVEGLTASASFSDGED
ncbi:SMI1/KNR4 family protein SUKH-1 [Streptomyces sp. PanSC19]|uniref:SMI1/KNR4 family protein n=1 Tax=Streptomyces sp. PanSC19 TaxID=1520455 RepID=UPI000F478A0F|nr:SMI1/KNR4 family protein [Streptomyces sp. PanSC19]ROQ33638.1 SMI1/KNR4 family protein SUKH-1 [Streptomyces sp. PanSC19]